MNLKKFTTCALAVFAGAFLCCSNTFFSALPKNCHINGIDVGGLPREKAKRLVRSEIASYVTPLKVATPCGEYVFSYPEIDFYDDLDKILPSAKKNTSYECNVTYYLKGEDSVIEEMIASSDREKTEPYVEFDGHFTYHEGRNGIKCDEEALRRDISASLNGGFYPVTLGYSELYPETSLSYLKSGTLLLSSFTTYFDSSNESRAHNISLAASSINGCVLKGGESFSFNSVVGRRSEERGYKPAKIIIDGEFVYGTGGGVCQVSTTLYNAALLSGMKIVCARSHSLPVSYVEPSFDAMVSSSSDMSFKNPYSFPVYIACETRGKITSGLKFTDATRVIPTRERAKSSNRKKRKTEKRG